MALSLRHRSRRLSQQEHVELRATAAGGLETSWSGLVWSGLVWSEATPVVVFYQRDMCCVVVVVLCVVTIVAASLEE
jgi:hypothetical protein